MRNSYDYYHFPRDTSRTDFKAWYREIRRLNAMWWNPNKWNPMELEVKAAHIWKRAFTPVDIYIWEDIDRFVRFDDIAQSLYL